MSRCVIDVGNTTIASAVYIDGKVFEPLRIPTHDIELVEDIHLLIEDVQSRSGVKVDQIVTCCGVSRIKSLMEEYENVYQLSLSYVTAEISSDIKFSYDSLKSLGPDRVANIIGVCALFSQPALIADCGTAITIDFVENSNFIGGIIAPGLHSGRDALTQYAPALPKIELSSTVELFETSTETCIRAGLINGARALIQSYIDYSMLRNPKTTIVLSGGDARFLIDGHSFSVDIIYEEWLTLYGLGHVKIA